MSSILAAVANGAVVSAALTAVVWLALRLAPRHRLNAATRYAFWWATLAATLALPGLYLRTSGDPRVEPIAAPGLKDSEHPATGEAAPTAAPTATPRTGGSPVPSIQPDRTASAWTSVARFRVPIAPLEVHRPEWIVIAWIGVSALLLLRLVVSWVLLDGRRARASLAPESLSARAEKWLMGCRSTRTGVRVGTSTEIVIPTAVGPRHPSILIPARLLQELEDDDLGQIVLHEAAHLARRDDYALLIERVIEALFAFHPVVRWIARQIDLEREVACDDFVVQATGQPRSYAAVLMRMVERCGGVRASLAGATAAGDRSHLARRVERLLDKSRHTGTRLLKTRLTVMVALLAVAAWTVGKTPAVLAFATPQSPVAAVPPAAPAPAPAPAVPATPAATAVPAPAPPPAAAIEPPAPLPAAAAPPLPPAQTAPPTPQIAGQIQVPVEVTDPMGRFVTGLERENFKLFEDGVEQQISQLVIDDAPISVGIVLDISGSMATRQPAVRAGLSEFLKTARPADEFFLVPFNNDPQLAVPFTTDTQAIENAVQNLQARGGTALRDAVHMALDEMKHARNRRQGILIFSDGDDNSSGRSAADLRRELMEAAPLIYSVNISDGRPARRGIAWVLGQESVLGGDGLVELGHTATGIAAALRNRYRLAFTSSNPAHDGKYRQLVVQIVAPVGLPPLKVRFRQGYFAIEQ